MLETPRGSKAVAKWLIQTGLLLTSQGSNYTKQPRRENQVGPRDVNTLSEKDLNTQTLNK